MSKGGSGEVKETGQQRAAAEHAANLFADYKKRWLPVQSALAQQTAEMGKPDSAARKMAAGRASTDTAIQFSKAQGGLEKGLANAGAAPGSGRFNLGVTGMGTDQAKATGLGAVAADQQIDDAYTQALASLAATGRGESAQVTDSLSRQATMSGRQAAADAEASLATRAAGMNLAGQFAGYGLQSAFKTPTPQGPGMGRVVLGAQADQFETNPQAGF